MNHRIRKVSPVLVAASISYTLCRNPEVTGAVLITTLAESFGGMPPMKIEILQG